MVGRSIARCACMRDQDQKPRQPKGCMQRSLARVRTQPTDGFALTWNAGLPEYHWRQTTRMGRQTGIQLLPLLRLPQASWWWTHLHDSGRSTVFEQHAHAAPAGGSHSRENLNSPTTMSSSLNKLPPDTSPPRASRSTRVSVTARVSGAAVACTARSTRTC